MNLSDREALALYTVIEAFKALGINRTLATALESESERADAAEAKLKVAREIINELVERREDQAGFYYVTKYMGGLNSVLSHRIETALAQLNPEKP